MKYRLDRALKILRLLQSDKRYDPVALTSELGVNRRTVYRDIAMLREMGIEVVFNHEYGHYTIERGTGDDRRGVETSQLRAAYNNATSDLDSSASVESIIRRVAHCLAGNLSLERSEAAEESRDLGGVATADKLISSTTESRPNSDQAGGTIRVDAATRSYADRSTSPVGPTNWLPTLDYLPLLRHAVEIGAIIETCNTEPADAGSRGTTVQRLSLAEFTVNREGVFLSGLDARGKRIRSISRSIRVVDQGIRDESTSRSPLTWQ